MYLFDTNIFLEILLDQRKRDICLKAVDSLTATREAWVSSFSLHGLEAILSNRKKDTLLENFLRFLMKHPHLYIYATSLEEEYEISKHLIFQSGLDFDDALQYYVAKKKKLTLVSLDHDFKKIRDLQVLSPEEYLLSL